MSRDIKTALHINKKSKMNFCQNLKHGIFFFDEFDYFNK